MRDTFHERPWAKARYRLILVLVSLALAVLLLVPTPLHGESHTTIIMGQVVNGTSGGEAPANLEVTLHMFGQIGEVDITTAMTDSQGRFRFDNVEVMEGLTYAVTASYRDVLYSRILDSPTLTEPVELLVYEATGSLEALQVDADVLLIRGADQDKGILSAFEVVRLVNGGDRTFVPDLAQPGSMNFLRFSLPAGATNLNVKSDLPSGQTVTVGTGFALTAPVTPGPHQVTYTYRIPYEGSRLELGRTFPMGAQTFRLLVEDGLGELRDSTFLSPLSPADVEGKLYRVWGASQLGAGARLDVEISDLPQPSPLRRVGDALTDGPYLKVGIPGVVGLVMAGLLVYVLLLRQPGKAPTVTSDLEAGVDAALTLSPSPTGRGMSVGQGEGRESERRALIEAIAQMDDLLQQGKIAREDYQQQRQELKARLLQITLTSEEGKGTA